MLSWYVLESEWRQELQDFAKEVLNNERQERVPEVSFQEFCEQSKNVSVRELARLQYNKIENLCMSAFMPISRYTTSVANRHSSVKKDADKLKALEEAYSDAIESGLIGKKIVKKPLRFNMNADRAYVRVRYRRALMKAGVPKPAAFA